MMKAFQMSQCAARLASFKACESNGNDSNTTDSDTAAEILESHENVQYLSKLCIFSSN